MKITIEPETDKEAKQRARQIFANVQEFVFAGTLIEGDVIPRPIMRLHHGRDPCVLIGRLAEAVERLRRHNGSIDG